MENTRQRKHLYKQAGIWLVALFVVLTAAFMRGKVNVKAAETDDITITRYVDGREQTDSWHARQEPEGVRGVQAPIVRKPSDLSEPEHGPQQAVGELS